MEIILKEENGIICIALNIFVGEIFEERDLPVADLVDNGLKALL